MRAIELRKGPCSIYLEYSGNFSGNLIARDIQLRRGDPTEISIDLSQNLRVRNRRGNNFADATALAEGEVLGLSLAQVSERQVVDALARWAPDLTGSRWRLILKLRRSHIFAVEPHLTGNDLFLRVAQA